MVEMNKPVDIHTMKQDIKDNSKIRDKLKEKETESDHISEQKTQG